MFTSPQTNAMRADDTDGDGGVIGALVYAVLFNIPLVAIAAVIGRALGAW
jgi:hypothetical protein